MADSSDWIRRAGEVARGGKGKGTVCAADAHVKGVISTSQMAKKKSEISKYLAKLGRKGGKATAQKLTAEQRKASARKAAKARWAKPQ
jgi:hypothetical protein